MKKYCQVIKEQHFFPAPVFCSVKICTVQICTVNFHNEVKIGDEVKCIKKKKRQRENKVWQSLLFSRHTPQKKLQNDVSNKRWYNTVVCFGLVPVLNGKAITYVLYFKTVLITIQQMLDSMFKVKYMRRSLKLKITVLSYNYTVGRRFSFLVSE